MARLPSRKALESMKRTDLQKLCKDYGVKANLKSEALIDLLLGANDSPKPGPSRSAGIRQASRSVPRQSSMIVHDSDSEADAPEDEAHEPPPGDYERPTTRRVSRAIPIPAPPPRTKKARETQLRLGVGRPAAAGGSGARAVTKSVSGSKGRRVKASKSVQPTEAPIPEEELEEPVAASMLFSRQTGLAEITNGLVASESVPASKDTEAGPSSVIARPSPDIGAFVADALKPLHEEINSLKLELSLLKAKTAPLEILQGKVDFLTSEMDGLRSQATEALVTSREIQQFLKAADPTTPPNKSPPREVPPAPLSMNVTSMAALGSVAASNARSPSPAGSRLLHGFTGDGQPPHPGFAPAMLGKRHRDSLASNVTGVLEEGQEDEFSQVELAERDARPMKKKPKLSQNESSGAAEAGHSSSLAEGSRQSDDMQENQVPQLLEAPNIPSFTVYHDPNPDYVDPPPPTNPLPEFFEPPSPPDSGVRPRQTSTSTTDAPENQHPFSFPFLPFTASTPAPGSSTAQSLFLPAQPYPEVPQSPTPVHSRTGLPGRATGTAPRSDIFGSFGIPGSGRSRSGVDRKQGDGALSPFVNPAMLGPSSRPGSTEPTGSTSDLPARRTMYGTELDGDTRFGDFGVEGVAGGPLTGFWAGGRP